MPQRPHTPHQQYIKCAIVTGCLQTTPSIYFLVLSGNQPAELRRQGATLSLANRSSLDPDHVLHGQFHESQDICRERLKSRRAFVPAARHYWTVFQKWTSVQPSGRTRNGTWSTLLTHRHSTFSLPRLAPDPWVWDYGSAQGSLVQSASDPSSLMAWVVKG